MSKYSLLVKYDFCRVSCNKVRSAFGVAYKTELHYAVGHTSMRRWDVAYPPPANGTKAIDLITVEKRPRCVVLAGLRWVPFILPSWCVRYALCTKDPVYGYWLYRFYYEVYAEPPSLSRLSKKFLPESHDAIDELLSFLSTKKGTLSLSCSKYG